MDEAGAGQTGGSTNRHARSRRRLHLRDQASRASTAACDSGLCTRVISTPPASSPSGVKRSSRRPCCSVARAAIRDTHSCNASRHPPIRWHRSGISVDAHIAALSTYLGHVSPADTYWYLSASPQLMALAADRLQARFGADR